MAHKLGNKQHQVSCGDDYHKNCHHTKINSDNWFGISIGLVVLVPKDYSLAIEFAHSLTTDY